MNTVKVFEAATRRVGVLIGKETEAIVECENGMYNLWLLSHRVENHSVWQYWGAISRDTAEWLTEYWLTEHH